MKISLPGRLLSVVRHTVAATCYIGLLFAGSSAHAQKAAAKTGETTTVLPGAAPFTQTLAQMVAHDRQIEAEIAAGIRPKRPRFSIGPDERFEENEEAMRLLVKPAPNAVKQLFPAPPLFTFDKNNTDKPGRRAFFGITPSAAPVSGGPLAPVNPGTSFDGLGLPDSVGGYIPPDTQGAIGPNHYVEMVNGSVGIYNRTGTRLSLVSVPTFFNFVSGGVTYPRTGAYDQRIVFDRRSGRFFATTMEFGIAFSYTVNGKTYNSEKNNNVLLAVSRTSDATGTWDKYVIPFATPDSGSIAYFTDYSSLGIDDNGVYMAATIFGTDTTTNNQVSGDLTIISTPKAPLIAASPTLGSIYKTTGITDFYATPQPALNYDAVAPTDPAFIFGAAPFYAYVNYRTVTWNNGVATLSTPSTRINTPGTSFPITAPAIGSPAAKNSLAIDAGSDFRLMMAAIRNKHLWAAHTVGVKSDGTSTGGTTTLIDRDACEWFEFDVSTAAPTLIQTGRVYDSSTNANHNFYYYPSIVETGQGNVVMAFSGSNPTQPVYTYYSSRLTTDPLGTMQSIIQQKTGSGSYNVTYGSGRNRWGDYSYVHTDPLDDMSVWSVQEYTKTKDNWGTWIAQLKSLAPTLAATSTGQAAQGQVNATLFLTGTNFYDPGADLPNNPFNHAVATVSGTGITVNKTVYNSPTSASIQFNVAANAPLGTHDVTFTNPDGQSVTLSNALTIVAGSPNLTVTPVLTRVASGQTNAIVATYTVNNVGNGSAVNITITAGSLKVGSTTIATISGFPITLGTIAAGGTATFTLRFPGDAGTTGTAALLTAAGTYTGGTFGGTRRVTLP